MTKKTQEELEAMSLDELNALSDELDGAKAAVLEEKRRVAARRAVLVKEAGAEAWGLTAEMYDEAKAAHARAREESPGQHPPLHHFLNRKRVELGKALRAAQTARAGAAELRKKAKGV